MKKVFALNFLLIFSLLFGGFLSCSNQDSEKDEKKDSVVATWIQNSDNSNFYIFYADNTVELYQSNKLTLTRNELTYEGSPASESVVTIKNKAGISINKFVILSDGGILTAKDSADSSKVFTVQKTSSYNGGNGNSGDNESGNNGSGNNVVCTYYMKGEESTYYVFYADNTAEYYSADKLANSRSEIKYEGNPLKAGTVTIKIALTNTPLITFTVKEADGTLIPYVELVPGFPTEFTLEKSGNENNDGDSEKQGDGSDEPADTPAQSDTKTDALCAWIADGDSSTYYIFYTDNTAEYYAGNVLQSARDALSYTGDPNAEGTVKITNKNTVPILIAAGKGTLTFTLEMSDSIFIAKENSSGLSFIVTTDIPSADNGETPSEDVPVNDQLLGIAISVTDESDIINGYSSGSVYLTADVTVSGNPTLTYSWSVSDATYASLVDYGETARLDYLNPYSSWKDIQVDICVSDGITAYGTGLTISLPPNNGTVRYATPAYYSFAGDTGDGRGIALEDLTEWSMDYADLIKTPGVADEIYEQRLDNNAILAYRGLSSGGILRFRAVHEAGAELTSEIAASITSLNYNGPSVNYDISNGVSIDDLTRYVAVDVDGAGYVTANIKFVVSSSTDQVLSAGLFNQNGILLGDLLSTDLDTRKIDGTESSKGILSAFITEETNKVYLVFTRNGSSGGGGLDVYDITVTPAN
ncbi:MAG: hypothetical protein IJ630_06850 [Treponema sp.]|nr:hypothetical protein [Treponema sp.]